MSCTASVAREPSFVAMEIRVRGRVQGVGFRPTVWRYRARTWAFAARCSTMPSGVLDPRRRQRTRRSLTSSRRIEREPPPLARIDRDRDASASPARCPSQFRIAESLGGEAHTAGRAGRRDLRRVRARRSPIRSSAASAIPSPIAPIAARASASSAGIPYDRANTTMAPFAMCRGLRARISRPRRPPLPRRGDRLPCLRAEGDAGPPRWPRYELRPAFDARRRRRGLRADPEGRDRRDQGHRRLPARLRRDQGRRGRAAAPAEAPRRQAVRADGARSRDHQALLHA